MKEVAYRRGEYAKQSSTCKVCGKEFQGRKDAKFCSGKCRVKAFSDRKKGVNNG